MYVGHALIAALVGLAAARLLGIGGRRAVPIAVTAGAFGLLPDVDLAYTLYAVVREGPTDVFPTTEHVWTESWVVHRTLTHSLVVGAAIVGLAGAVAVATWASPGRPGTDWNAGPLVGRRPDLLASAAALALAVALGVLAYRADGGLGVVTVGLYVAGTLAVAAAATRRGVPPGLVVLAAAVGVGLHPFGDLWMGRPPIAFYPLGSGEPLPEVRFAADPTRHFLAAVLVEVGLFAGVLLAVPRILGRSVPSVVSPAALLGTGLVGALALVPAPTFAVAYQFSFSMVGLAVIAGLVAWTRGDRRRPPAGLLRPTATAAVAMVLGVVAYGAAYVALG